MATPGPPALSASASPLVGLVAVPLTLVGVSLALVRGGSMFSSPTAPWTVLTNPPSPSNPLLFLQWVTPPRDLQIATDFERLMLAYLASGLLLFVLNRLAPNRNRPAPSAPGADPRKVRSAVAKPAAWILAAAALHITAMRVLALRSSPGYAARVDARALLGKKATGPPFQDMGAMIGGLMGLLLAFRELGNVADRTGELFGIKIHRNVAQVGHVLTGAVRFFFAVALFRTCVVPPLMPA